MRGALAAKPFPPFESALSISQWTLFLFPLFACSLFSAILATVAFRYRDRSGALPLSVLLVGTTVWTFTYGMQLAQTSLAAKLFWSRLTYIGVLTVPVALLAFTLAYTDRDDWLSLSRFAFVCVVPAVLLLLALVRTRMLMPAPTVVNEGGLLVLDFEVNPFWILLLLYLYALILISVVMVGSKFVQLYRVGTFRGQTLSILVAMCVPLVLDVYAQLTGLNIALAPVGLTIAGILVSVAMFRYQLFDVSPVARRTVVENMDNPFIVLDHSGNVIDANDAALSAAPLSGPRLVDRQVSEVLPQLSPLEDDGRGEESVPDEIAVEHDDSPPDPRIYELDVTALHDESGEKIATAVVLRNVTEKRHRQRELEQQKRRLERKTEQLSAQNERLDDFASLLSHDLRNPLSVSKGYLEMVDEEGQETEVQKVREGLNRIEQLIDEALQLAREGQSVTETETVGLATVARDAWQSVDTEEATLVTETDRLRVEADPPRLQRLFENLFRNAVEHSPGEVTVSVTRTAEGFVVADDGPGLPDDERDQIFEKGFTTADDGTGFGLAIVETIATAHGWEVLAAESEGGGAAFRVDCRNTEVE